MSRPARDKPTTAFGGEPRAQLLPPSVREREQVRSAQRMAATLIVGAVAVSAALTGFGFFRSVQSLAELGSAQTETQAIVAEQSKYGEATRISTTLTEIAQGQTASTSLEILWAPILRQVAGAAPGGVLTSVDVQSQAPWEPPLTPAGPLRSSHIASLTLIYSSTGPLDAAALTAALSSVPGYADSVVQSATAQNGTFTTTVSLTLGDGALAQRYPASPASHPSPTPTAPVASAEGANR
jgi:hypothetical protein